MLIDCFSHLRSLQRAMPPPTTDGWPKCVRKKKRENTIAVGNSTYLGFHFLPPPPHSPFLSDTLGKTRTIGVCILHGQTDEARWSEWAWSRETIISSMERRGDSGICGLPLHGIPVGCAVLSRAFYCRGYPREENPVSSANGDRC